MIQNSASLRDQLSPLAAKLREGRAVIRPVSQVVLRLKEAGGRERFGATVDDILKWMNRRAGKALPEQAWQRKTFDLTDIGAQRTAAVALDAPRYWSARLDDADKSVPLRTWITEIGVGVEDGGHVLFGVRLICATRGEDAPYERSIPGFVRAILASGPAEFDGVPISDEPRLIATAGDVADLVALLESPSRRAEVIVFALPEHSSNIDDAIASVRTVHQRTLGVAHVLALTGPASYLLTDAVGRQLSVFRQAVRTYRPTFRSWVDQPTDHPLALPARIAQWQDDGPKAFERWLVDRALQSSVHGSDRDHQLPSFNTVRQWAAEANRATLKARGATDTDLVELYEQENEQLRREMKEQKDQYDGLLIAADAEREAAVLDANAARAQALDRLHRIRVLEQRFAAFSVAADTPIPKNLENFESWCKEHLAGSVEVTNRAHQGVRKSEYHDPSFIYKALLLLRDFYVPMRTDGAPESREAYIRELERLQLEDSATGDAIKYSADQYSVQYGGSRRSLDRHLKGSNSRDRRYGFRLYFFWDAEGQVAVVGWLPTHLDNRAT